MNAPRGWSQAGADMQLSIANVIDAAEIARVRSVLAEARFEHGAATAGWAARLVKDNEQAVVEARVGDVRDELVARVEANPVFRMAARPCGIVNPMFSRYRDGQAYGTHVDNALMGGRRTDVSFTLFLADPASYDGGELVIETSAGEDAVKLEAGSMIVYPATTLHRVEPVTRGERLVMVGWARSYVRDAARRELLFDLETALRVLFDAHGKTAEHDLISKSLANLMRMWAED